MNYDIDTDRLLINDWHYFDPKKLGQNDLAEIISNLLTRDTTQHFPCMWQGNYSKKRAEYWITERDNEAKTLLAVHKQTNTAVGYLSFFKTGDNTEGTKLNIGYLCSHELWGNGLATELVEGFIDWCKKNSIHTITAAVDFDNIASMRVLEKNNFFDTR